MGIRVRHLFLVFCALALSVRAARIGGCGEKQPEFIEQVFLTEEAAVKAVFSENEKVVKRTRAFTQEQKKRIESRLGWTVAESSVAVFEGYRDSQTSGWAVIAEEIGKFKPMTFMVKVSNKGKVERVEMMVYREPVGAEVRRKRFWGQFKGKSAQDRLRINRDILNITGATMSVQAMTAGVRKALVILEELYTRK